ncbi:MAG: type II toxin-antitoxin system RelE/ParE family toxin [Defluviitaleaceae bacterium]|nr:type II toxin-antitoxin system RelE/ParE family toxin [Defluviitaleaceae bacterium]
MKKYEVSIEQSALDDMVSIIEYIAEHGSPQSALTQYGRILKKIDSLELFPNRGSPKGIAGDAEVRSVNVDRYKIYFLVIEEESRVEVRRIVHMKMDFKFRIE